MLRFYGELNVKKSTIRVTSHDYSLHRAIIIYVVINTIKIIFKIFFEIYHKPCFYSISLIYKKKICLYIFMNF